MAQVLKELEEADAAQIVKLGDASIASPFTYKQSSIECGKYKRLKITFIFDKEIFEVIIKSLFFLQSVPYNKTGTMHISYNASNV